VPSLNCLTLLLHQRHIMLESVLADELVNVTYSTRCSAPSYEVGGYQSKGYSSPYKNEKVRLPLVLMPPKGEESFAQGWDELPWHLHAIDFTISIV
jgi:hypothetical protein